LRRAPVEPLHLRLALAVEASLLDEAGAELGERGDEDIHLVQRVLDVDLGVELELEVDPLRAVRDLKDDPRLRVDVPAALVAERVRGGLPRSCQRGARPLECRRSDTEECVNGDGTPGRRRGVVQPLEAACPCAE